MFFSELKKKIFTTETQKTIDKVRVRALIGLKLQSNLEPAQAAQDTRALLPEQRKIKNIGEYIQPVQPVQPVQALDKPDNHNLSELLKKTLDLFPLDRDEALRDEELFELMERDLKLNRTESTKIISILMRDGTIFSPRPGFYKRA